MRKKNGTKLFFKKNNNELNVICVQSQNAIKMKKKSNE